MKERGKIEKDFLHHLSPCLANYLQGLRKNTKTRELSNSEQRHSTYSKETFDKGKGRLTETQQWIMLTYGYSVLTKGIVTNLHRI
jgi:hypothetical protein